MATEHHKHRQKLRVLLELIILLAVIGLYKAFFNLRGMKTSLRRYVDLKCVPSPYIPEPGFDHIPEPVFDPRVEVPESMFILSKKKVTWCQPAKVASTSTKKYFYDIADGEVEFPEGALYGIQETNFQHLRELPIGTQKWVKKTEEYVQVFFARNVVERFISGFLDKVIIECNKPKWDESYVYNWYINKGYGFSCEKHQDLEAFISFMETVPRMEGHFHAQAPLCMLKTYPYTDIIFVDDYFNENLRALSKRLGVSHPTGDEKQTRKHSTGAKTKMANMFEGKEYLLDRILKLFDQDCRLIPNACDVDELRSAIASKKSLQQSNII
jgi:hypothetical protein